jgi:galactose-1-phosphate uridylyltransferase
MQAISTHRVPAGLASQYAGEAAHRGENGTNFWDDLVAAETDGPRWLGHDGGWSRVVAFAPQHPIPETLVISDHIDSMQSATDDDLYGLAGQMVKLANAHHAVGYSAFNMALHPTAPVAGSRLRARYVPRAYIVPKLSSSDQTWIHVGSGEGLCIIPPENFAKQVQDALHG